MGDVTMTESTLNKLLKDAKTVKESSKEATEKGAWAVQKEGGRKIKDGQWREGLLRIGGANAGALQGFFIGGLVSYVMTSDWWNGLSIFKEKWWAKPLAVLLIGYVLYQRYSAWGANIIAAGAALAMQAYQTRPKEEKKDDKNKADANKGDANKKDAPTPDTKGFDEAGGWDWQDTYGRHGRWVETPHGARAYMTEGPGAYAAERMVDSVFAHG